MSVLSEQVSRRSTRVRSLNPAAQEQFEQTVSKYYTKLNDVKADLNGCLEEVNRPECSEETLRSLDSFLTSCVRAYEKVSDIFCEFLRATRSHTSESELTSHMFVRETLLAKARMARSKIKQRLQLISDVMDQQSDISYRPLSQRSQSSRSSISSILRQKEAKLEAHRTMLKHLDEELALEAQLKRIRATRELKMYESEVKVLKDEGSLEDLVPSQSCEQRTEEYVASLQNPVNTHTLTSQTGQEPATDPHDATLKHVLTASDVYTPNVQPDVQSQLNPTVEPFTPRETYQAQQSQLVDIFTKHLVKRDLILSRLSKYDDNPLTFLSWKLSFQGIMEEIDASKTEQLQLLCDKLGPESSRQATTIRICNAYNPSLAIQKIWERLEHRFGAPELIEKHLIQRIQDFPDISTDTYGLLYDLTDLAAEIASIKSQPKFGTLFAYFDSKKGVNELVEKLPWNMKEKWTSEATKYKQQKNVLYPPFSFFVKFLDTNASMRNDPAFQYERKGGTGRQKQTSASQYPQTRQKPASSTKRSVTVLKTETVESSDASELCPLHKNGRHVLNECRPFRQKSIDERKKIILTSGICFRCCSGKKHRAKNCKSNVKCDICQMTTHPTALHEENSGSTPKGSKVYISTSSSKSQNHEGEGHSKTVTTMCTQLSGLSISCAKIIPVQVFHESNPEKVAVVYATIDDQSNHSLGTSSLFDCFNEQGTDVSYTLVSCSGAVAAAGRLCTGYKVQSLDGSCELSIPSLLECNDIPSNRNEIPSPDVAMHHPHLSRIVPLIPPVMKDAGMELLLGRDIVRAHIVEDQIVGEEDQPFAQKLPLGWVIIGQTCLGGVHVPEVRTMKTFVLGNGRHSTLKPCENELSVHRDLFEKTDRDEEIGLSVQDRDFLSIMEKTFEKDEDGHWVAPLPFKKDRTRLPDNRSEALRRARSFDRCLRHNQEKCAHVKDIMQKLFDRGHAQKAPDVSENEECWFLPMFGVYHPRKPDSIRVVFDSSAQCEGISLNDVLLKGPDLANSLQGILMRFRLEEFAVLADVEQMFHNFQVAENHRNYLRFFWHPNNDLDSPLEEFRMTVHVFGNRPSPAVANYGLCRSVLSAGSDVQEFVSNDFYVDDGLMSFASVGQAVDVVKRTQTALHEGGRLKLHKIASNSTEILEQFPKEELAKDLKDLDLGQDCLPNQRSLGICWDIVSDCFSFRVDKDLKPFTRRGVLSVINSLFDPIGFTAPVTLEGKLLMREVMSSQCGWDESLPETFRIPWEKWVDSLSYLQNFSIPRMYCSLSVELSDSLEVHVFSDASKDAVAAVAFIKVFSRDSSDEGFLMGKAKVAPAHGHTIPRLELCAALLAVEIAENIREQLGVSKDLFTFYTDSRVVLGYISNESKRFHVYVANRVSRIRSFCGPQSWRYIASGQNPADVATRGCSAKELPSSLWINGPPFLGQDSNTPDRPQDLTLLTRMGMLK